MRSNKWGVWKYIGPGRGLGSLHIIVDMDKEWVTTWSEPIGDFGGDDHGVAGFSWLGPKECFTKEFQRVG